MTDTSIAREAESAPWTIDERYDDSTPVGIFMMRRALAPKDKEMQARAADLIHKSDQYRIVSRLSYDEMMTFTVFRKRKYEEVRVKTPDRWPGGAVHRRGALISWAA